MMQIIQEQKKKGKKISNGTLRIRPNAVLREEKMKITKKEITILKGYLETASRVQLGRAVQESYNQKQMLIESLNH